MVQFHAFAANVDMPTLHTIGKLHVIESYMLQTTAISNLTLHVNQRLGPVSMQ
jgi:hypothetical protein